MTDRRSTALRPPPSPEALARFPRWHVHAGTTLHRVTRGSTGPWWFASSGDGRFDLPPPRGTCYLADDALVALLEVLGMDESAGVVSADVVERLTVWAVSLPIQCSAADATHRQARGSGVTAELATIADYELPQAWAVAFHAAGFDGVRYRARHDPAGERCLALFGRAGERRSWKRGRGAPATILSDRLTGEAGIAVAPRPPNADELSDLRDRPPG